MATIDTIRKILGDNLSIEPEQIEEDTTLDSIDIDSLDLVELICDIEDAEGIDFGEPEGLETIGGHRRAYRLAQVVHEQNQRMALQLHAG